MLIACIAVLAYGPDISLHNIGRLGLRGVLFALAGLGLCTILLASTRTLGRLGLRSVPFALAGLGLRGVLLASRRTLGRWGSAVFFLPPQEPLAAWDSGVFKLATVAAWIGALLQSLHQRGAQLRMSPTDRTLGYFAMKLDELGHREVNVRVQALLQLVLPAI